MVGRLADRRGQRGVVLAFSLANPLAVASLVVGTLAGGTVPLVGPPARARVNGTPHARVGGQALSP
ncbi:hypothetical protein ACH47Z_36990 [Streptomyces sp. NPDC020192]|uniref:hypothetical protein n=1 Tax=Streptomyces sp. NPDC020192 TaxID=3365066 RepID=UPI0037B07273